MDRHRTDLVSLLFGLLFVGLGAALLLGTLPGIGPWLWQAWPLLLIVAGGWLVVAVTRGSRQSGPDDGAEAGHREEHADRLGDEEDRAGA